jgi:hypothetical protein
LDTLKILSTRLYKTYHEEKQNRKKYRHGIEVKTDKKIKKSELLRRIEMLEAIVNGGALEVKSIIISGEKASQQEQ